MFTTRSNDYTNLLGDESSAPEKLCTALFRTGGPKITMKRHADAACAKITQATRARAPQITYVWLRK